MTVQWGGQQLLDPLSAEQPCGLDLEDTALLASFDSFRLFGQSTPLDSAPEPGETRVAKPFDSPEWIDIQNRSLEALGKSKDLRLLAHLAAAALRTEGIPAFASTLSVASQWLERYWTQAYPLVDGDGMLRRNVLNCFADTWAVVDAVRRLPLVTSRQHGKVSLRDVEIATGQAPGEARLDEAKINAAFAEMPLEQLQQLQQGAAEGLAALTRLGVSMADGAGPDAAPSFEGLSTQLTRLERLVRTQLQLRRQSEAGAEPATSGVAPMHDGRVQVAVGAIASREDAVRALEAVAEFFRRHEPSSPVPLLVDRARRLVAKDFLEVLADVAPDALGQARAAGGLRQGD